MPDPFPQTQNRAPVSFRRRTPCFLYFRTCRTSSPKPGENRPDVRGPSLLPQAHHESVSSSLGRSRQNALGRGWGLGKGGRVGNDRMAAQRAVPVSDEGALRASTAEMMAPPSPQKSAQPLAILAPAFLAAPLAEQHPGHHQHRGHVLAGQEDLAQQDDAAGQGQDGDKVGISGGTGGGKTADPHVVQAVAPSETTPPR